MTHSQHTHIHNHMHTHKKSQVTLSLCAARLIRLFIRGSPPAHCKKDHNVSNRFHGNRYRYLFRYILMRFNGDICPNSGKCQEFCQTLFPGYNWTERCLNDTVGRLHKVNLREPKRCSMIEKKNFLRFLK